jgi:hypothetical protein
MIRPTPWEPSFVYCHPRPCPCAYHRLDNSKWLIWIHQPIIDTVPRHFGESLDSMDGLLSELHHSFQVRSWS